MPQPSGSSGRYQPEPFCAPYASLSTYGGVTVAGCEQPVNGTCTNVFTPSASARASVSRHCSYESTGKKSEPFAVMRVPSVPKRAPAARASVVTSPLVVPTRNEYVVDGSRSLNVTECTVDAVLSRAL